MTKYTPELIERLFKHNGVNICTNFVHISKTFFIDENFEAQQCFEILKIAHERIIELNKNNNYVDVIPEPQMEYTDNPDYVTVSGFIPFTIEMCGELKQVKNIAMNHYDSY